MKKKSFSSKKQECALFKPVAHSCNSTNRERICPTGRILQEAKSNSLLNMCLAWLIKFWPLLLQCYAESNLCSNLILRVTLILCYNNFLLFYALHNSCIDIPLHCQILNKMFSHTVVFRKKKKAPFGDSAQSQFEHSSLVV